MLKDENIICISTMGWDFLWTRKQRFMDMLADYGNRILYVEPIYSITNLWQSLSSQKDSTKRIPAEVYFANRFGCFATKRNS